MFKHMTNMDKVREFHQAFGLEIDSAWTADLLDLRQSLIEEEIQEVEDEFDKVWPYVYTATPMPTEYKAALTKELCDLLYVIYGTGVALGLPLDTAFNRVHTSNMSKLGPDGKPVYREDGKVLKGENYKPADLKNLFDA